MNIKAMAFTLKLNTAKQKYPGTDKYGYRTTVSSNGKADMDSLVAYASRNTTMHSAELEMAFKLMLDAIEENLCNGNIVELKGIGNIGFSCSGKMTDTADAQKDVEHTIGVAFYPSDKVQAAVKTAKTVWKSEEKDEEEGSSESGSSSGNTPTTNPDMSEEV